MTICIDGKQCCCQPDDASQPDETRWCSHWIMAEHQKYMQKELAQLRAELETERMRLAACGIVADSNTKESAERNRKMNPEYHSASLDSVIMLVDSEMQLRTDLAAAQKRIAELEGRTCERCARIDKCSRHIIYRPFRANVIIYSCSEFKECEPKKEG